MAVRVVDELNHPCAGALSSTLLFNLLSFPAGVVPVSSVTPADEILLKQFKGNFQDLWDREFVQVGLPSQGCY